MTEPTTPGRPPEFRQLDDQARGLAAVIATTTDLPARVQILEHLVDGGDPRTLGGVLWWLAFWMDQVRADPAKGFEDLDFAADVALSTSPPGLAAIDDSNV